MRLADILTTKSLPMHAATVATPATQSRNVADVASVAWHFVLLAQTATEACGGLTRYITSDVLLAKLAPEDIVELEAYPDPLPFLRSYAIACVWTDFRRDGIAPPTWDKPAHCDLCGPVLLWAAIDVAGCPWCYNRHHALPIPRPPVSQGSLTFSQNSERNSESVGTTGELK